MKIECVKVRIDFLNRITEYLLTCPRSKQVEALLNVILKGPKNLSLISKYPQSNIIDVNIDEEEPDEFYYFR